MVLAYAGIGGVAIYQGLQQRAAITRQEAEAHYQRGLQHIQNGVYELAIAEFEHTLRLDPTHRQARDALRDAKTFVMAQPTPTSATLNEALANLLREAETLVHQQHWAEAAERAAQIRDLNPDFQPQKIAELLFEANSQLGWQLFRQGQVADARDAFERALRERPNDPELSRQVDLATLYLSARAAWSSDWPQVINYLEQLYTLVPDYLDVHILLAQAYENYGDALGTQSDWCAAETQYMQAAMLQPGEDIQGKYAKASWRCANPTPTPLPNAMLESTTPQPGIPSEATSVQRIRPPARAQIGGAIFFSRFDEENNKWQILAVDLADGTTQVVLIDGSQPAVSRDRKAVAYHSERGDSIGIHVLDLFTAQDTRATWYGEDVTPDWAPDGTRFVFPSRRSGDRKWVIYIGWADGRGEAVPLVEGRTPAWSPDGSQIVYQGTDPQGNNPGLYLIPAGGGPSNRLTEHESDRAPTWSPDGSRIAYMSSQSGRWQLYLVDLASGVSQQLTSSDSNDGLPVWSPDGAYLAFVSDREGRWGIYVMPADGGEAMRVADWGANRQDWLIERIAWAP
ncbi:MAG: tetratricopeptide repeat protein [Anaerolineae bacterium]